MTDWGSIVVSYGSAESMGYRIGPPAAWSGVRINGTKIGLDVGLGMVLVAKPDGSSYVGEATNLMDHFYNFAQLWFRLATFHFIKNGVDDYNLLDSDNFDSAQPIIDFDSGEVGVYNYRLTVDSSTPGPKTDSYNYRVNFRTISGDIRDLSIASFFAASGSLALTYIELGFREGFPNVNLLNGGEYEIEIFYQRL